MPDDDVLRELRNISRLLGQPETRRQPAHEQPLHASKDNAIHVAVSGGGGGGPASSIDVVDFYRAGLDAGGAPSTGFDTFVLVDRDNSTGNYTHKRKDWVRLFGASGFINKVKANDSWQATLMVVLAINATDADLAQLGYCAIHVNSTTLFQRQREFVTYPMALDLTVEGGSLRHVTPSRIILGDATVNTTAGLEDAVGDTVIPEVGDVLIRTERTLGNGEAECEFEAFYRVGGEF